MSNTQLEGYPSWLPPRPPPPILDDPSFLATLGGRNPTPRSVRIVNLAPPKLSRPPPRLPPRFNAKNLHIQLLRSPSLFMKAYFYIWPFLIFYHIPLQSFFDFNAVYILFQVSRYPSSKSWALATTAYIACWLVSILIVFLTYEIIYSFVRRWRLRRPLILPVYLSSPAFNIAALTSYSTFSFLQHIRLSALSQEHADAIAPLPPSPSHSKVRSDDNVPDTPSKASLAQFLAETSYFYSQNLPTVGLLLPRAGLSLALLLSFSAPTPVDNARDATFFNSNDGSLTNYAKAVLIANAAWTAWRSLVLLLSWLGLWFFSSHRLAGLSGPRHIWEEHEQEKTRSLYSSAASEHGARDSLLYGQQDANQSHNHAYDAYRGDELPWEWREHTRMRVQDAFEFCLTSDVGRRSDPLVWGPPTRRTRSPKGKERSADETETEEGTKRGFEGIEKVLAAIGFGGAPSSPSAARRGVLSRDLFDTPPEPVEALELVSGEERKDGPSTTVFPLKTPKLAKRNSRDKDTIQHDISLVTAPPQKPPTIILPPLPQMSLPATPGAPLLALPYPFTQPVVGRVSSGDLVPFPAVGGVAAAAAESRTRSSSHRSGSEHTESGSGSGHTGTGTGTGEEEEEEEDEEDENPTSNIGSESMSSLGHPISPTRGYPFLSRVHTRVRGHSRNPSGVSSGMSSVGGPRTQGRRSTSSGATGTGSFSGGRYSLTYSVASSGGVRSQESEQSRRGESIVSQSTGNRSTTTEEEAEGEGEERSISVSVSSKGTSAGASGIPMPPRHPNLQGEGSEGPRRIRKVAISAPSSVSGSVSVGSAKLSEQGRESDLPVVFPSAMSAGRADSAPGGDVEGRYEDRPSGVGFEGYEWAGVEEEDEEEMGEREDRVGLLVPSPHVSMVNVSGNGNGSNGNVAGRSRTNSIHSFISSASRVRSRTASANSHSSHSNVNSRSPSVRERASSVGHSVRSLVVSGLGLGVGLGGSRPQRSRVNSSMARLEEEREDAGGGVGSGVIEQEEVGEFGERIRVVEAEAEAETESYASAASHSMSGSDNSSGENYTFGRPVAFMRHERERAREREREERVEEEEGDDGTEDGDDVVRAVDVEEEDDDEEDVYERQAIDIPGRRPFHHRPSLASIGHPSPSPPTTLSSHHPDYISTAPGSFVTAPPSFLQVEGSEGSVGSGSVRTVGGGGSGVIGGVGGVIGGVGGTVGGVGGRMGGMVERVGEDMGAQPGSWRIA